MIKLKEKYYVKIVPQRGETVHRFELTRRHIVALASVTVACAVLLLVVSTQAFTARAEIARLQQQTVRQRSALQKSTHQTVQLQSQLRRMLRVLNLRHIAEVARARVVAAIPSIDPVNGAAVVGCFCYRSYPDAEFHKGVDLGADYGEVVRAAADGIVASADWDGAYGKKIVIDHGNGYQTWYAHLSRIDVHAGEHVTKGVSIALVGATGFATGPHLHYQVMLNGTPIDPEPFLNGVPKNVLASLK